jgi:hypothetical protein
MNPLHRAICRTTSRSELIARRRDRRGARSIRAGRVVLAVTCREPGRGKATTAGDTW